MRFACQSCGKAYNLPEDKIADKSNVKLKCRVCGAIVEVKKHGDVVAQILGDVDIKHVRVSEAPTPLTSVSADDADDATHAIAVGDQILGEGTTDEAAAAALLGHVKSALGQQRGLSPLPPTPSGSVPLIPNFGVPSGSSAFVSAAPNSFGAAPAGATPVPPPLAPPEPPAFPRQDAQVAPPLPSPVGAVAPSPPPPPPPLPSPPPPLPSPGGPDGIGVVAHGVAAHGGSIQNGSNGLAPRFADVVPLADEPLPPVAAVAPVAMAAVAPLGDVGGAQVVEVASGRPVSDDTTRKMLAALATGILIGFIIARLFF